MLTYFTLRYFDLLCVIPSCSVVIVTTLGLVGKRWRGTRPTVRAATSETDLQTGR